MQSGTALTHLNGTGESESEVIVTASLPLNGEHRAIASFFEACS